ncbi:MAG: RNA methyltransferase [Balneolales bacterium]
MDRKKLADEIAFFSDYVSEHKKKLFREKLEYRTRFFTVVLEDIFQSQNASAVLRSCDGFGFQDVHVIENRNNFDIDKGVTTRSDKWLTIHRYNHQGKNNTEIAYNRLKQDGYRIVAVSPNQPNHTLPEFCPDKPVVLVFGAEKAGLSDIAVSNADDHLQIPMYGFIESFNISVCAGICLYHLRNLIETDNHNLSWMMSYDQKKELYLQWLRNSVQQLKALDLRFYETFNRSS